MGEVVGLESIQGHFVLDYNVNARAALQSLGLG